MDMKNSLETHNSDLIQYWNRKLGGKLINAKTTGTENFVSFPSFNTKPFLNCNICCLLPTYCLPGLYDAKLFTHISFHLYSTVREPLLLPPF